MCRQGLTCIKCLNLNNQVVATSIDSKLSRVDIRMTQPLWKTHDSNFEAASGQCLSLSNNDSFAVVNSRSGKMIVFDMMTGKPTGFLRDEEQDYLTPMVVAC